MANTKQYTAAEEADREEAKMGGPGYPGIERWIGKGYTDEETAEWRSEIARRHATLRAWGATPAWVVHAVHRALAPHGAILRLRPEHVAAMSDGQLLELREIGVKALAYIRAVAPKP